MRSHSFLTAMLAVVASAGSAGAAEILVSGNITTSQEWTPNHTYNLQGQVFVMPGATLTIKPGVVVASDQGGSIAIAKGAQIIARGTQDAPIIFTSKADVATWAADPSHPTGGDPRTGSWREAANEWGNVTIMGNGYVGSCLTGNSASPNANNRSDMEGLIQNPSNPGLTQFGGGDDNDDSGALEYVSIRYGGKVVALNNELNGLSLGGIGSATDINHIEIMNNVDDGIEVWGGCVNVKHFSIWNVGDDSMDVDQGWRGRAQFGLIVQGHSLDAPQGSGVGDNGFETDGAEFSDHQPVTSPVFWNCTFIGQPQDGDGATAWRDNARVQYRSCIFMDCGERVVRFDNIDGDPCGTGYGHNGTTGWPAVWTTPYNSYSTVNAPANPAAFYKSQVDGTLCQMSDSVFYSNNNGSAYTEFNNLNLGTGFNNVVEPNDSPIKGITRGAPIVRGGKVIEPVTNLDPTAANDAWGATETAPNDGFFTPVDYRGAFGHINWLAGWTAADAFNLTNAEVKVCDDIATSTTWSKNNTYNLQGQIYVLPGATLTIEAGTVVASDLGGSIAVAKGAQIIANGTQEDPIIFTSKADVATWTPDATHPTGGDPKTGSWREAANEWGNLTIMGNGYVGSCLTGNSASPNANNRSDMEGLIQNPSNPGLTQFGGGNDADDSGSLEYVSIRYGGKVVALNNELNGLSLGGIGSATDINHIEIMNNVDDGIEIWGGCVNVKHFSIWNVGDDSMDVDQGWRGRAQFGLIVQGHSLDASQGSGVGDNGFETDGAEFSDHQPVTSTVFWNCTFVGQPQDGDGATAWRDNARVQYRSCVFTDCGERVVRFDNIDGDPCGTGYGHNGTTGWPAVWTTPYNSYSTVNAPGNPAAFYKSQVDGTLCQMSDSVFYNNGSSSAYTEFNNLGLGSGFNNVVEPTNSPIQSITRGSAIVRGGKIIEPVTHLDPRAQNDALTATETAPNDGFFTPVNYRGAFDADNNWLCGWTAASAFGMTGTQGSVTRFADRCGAADVVVSGSPYVGNAMSVDMDCTQGQFQMMWMGLSRLGIPLLCAGCNVGTGFDVLISGSSFPIPLPNNGAIIGAQLYVQGADMINTGSSTCLLGGVLDLTLTDTVLISVGG